MKITRKQTRAWFYLTALDALETYRTLLRGEIAKMQGNLASVSREIEVKKEKIRKGKI